MGLAAFLAHSSDASFRAGRIAGRLLYLILLPVLVMALIYWLRGRSGPKPKTFAHAISRWWVWVFGLLIGLVLLFALSVALAASG